MRYLLPLLVVLLGYTTEARAFQITADYPFDEMTAVNEMIVFGKHQAYGKYTEVNRCGVFLPCEVASSTYDQFILAATITDPYELVDGKPKILYMTTSKKLVGTYTDAETVVATFRYPRSLTRDSLETPIVVVSFTYATDAMEDDFIITVAPTKDSNYHELMRCGKRSTPDTIKPMLVDSSHLWQCTAIATEDNYANLWFKIAAVRYTKPIQIIDDVPVISAEASSAGFVAEPFTLGKPNNILLHWE